MRGKYSPTVSTAYAKNQSWWEDYAYTNVSGDEFVMYDPEGYDSYGYNKDNVDRAGNHENEYAHNDCPVDEDDYNIKFDDAWETWGFDGVKPVKV